MKLPAGGCLRATIPFSVVSGLLNLGVALGFLALGGIAFPHMVVMFLPSAFCLVAACLFCQAIAFAFGQPISLPAKALFLFLGLYQLAACAGVLLAGWQLRAHFQSLESPGAGWIALGLGLWPGVGAVLFGVVWWQCRATTRRASRWKAPAAGTCSRPRSTRLIR